MSDHDDRYLADEATRRAAYKIKRYFPDCQPGCKPASPRKEDHVGFCRALYPRHLAFFRYGGAPWLFRERMFLKGNRVGGTEAAAYEVTCHLTGRYPHWWDGRRFTEAGEWWAAGVTATSTRDVSQLALYGPPHAPKTGMIPAHLIIDRSMKSGVPDGIDQLWIRHATGKIATIQFKSYHEGREGFQGTAKQGIWEDEEPGEGIPEECLLRTATTQGIILYTFTPLQGLTPFVGGYLDSCVMANEAGELVEAKSEFWKQT